MTFAKKNKKRPAEPTKSELEILQIIWQFGPSTARLVNDHLNAEKREVIYKSTLKLMQIMIDKGLLKKDNSQRSHIYFAAVEEKQTKGLLLDKVVDNLFGGSAAGLMMQLLGDQGLLDEEIAEFRELIKKLDDKR